MEKLSALRARRDKDSVKRTMDAIRSTAEGDENLVPPILEAVKSQATLGEISDALRDVFGEQREQVVL